jgi:hypothetical protein
MSLGYNNIKIEGRVRISPSGMYSYYDNSEKWYRSNVLGKKDDPSEIMIIGTILHSRIEDFFNGKMVDEVAEAEYLAKEADNAPIDTWQVISSVEETWKYLLNEYLPTLTKPDSQEEALTYVPESNSDVFLGGTYDYIRGSVLGDYKTTTELPDAIKTQHRVQAYLYAWMKVKSGYHIDEIEITYIRRYFKGKPNPKYDGTKKYKEYLGAKEAGVNIIREKIDPEFMETVLSHVRDLGTMISMCKADDSLVPLFFRRNLLSHF